MLKVYNYLHRQLEEFKPLHEGFVGMYVCGPTVYGDAHLGHAKAYVTFDVIHRYFEYLGYKVRYVQNITDVGHLTGDGDFGEDKVNRQARKEQLQPMEVVETYTRNYFRDMDALNVLRPDISPRASGHVPEQIELAKNLVEAGYAYESNGNVYFSVTKWPDYGKLSGRKIEEQEEGSRIDTGDDKQDPRDFAVWRAATSQHLMQWDSPWGAGFPGWHAECTVMARKYLGLPFDIHGGGLENIFPHNESEIAQCEAAYDKPFAQYWLLNNMVTIDGIKMGKSLGNFITVEQMLSGDHPRLSQAYPPQVVRYFILSSHYRQPTDFSDEALSAASKGYQRLINTLSLVQQKLEQAPDGEVSAAFDNTLAEHKTRFEEAMNNDFNTPQAVAVLFDLNKVVNTLLNSGETITNGTLQAITDFYQTHGGDVLGLISGQNELSVNQSSLTAPNLEEKLIQILIDMRQSARKNKDYATSDAIRDQLAEIGVVLEDRPDGTAWRVELE